MGIGSYRHRVTLEQPGPAPVVTAAVWRIVFSATNDPDGLVALRDLALAAVVGGPDLCTGGMASASSEWGEFYTAAAAFDDPAEWSYWSSAAGAALPQWLQYTFPAPVEVREYRVRAEGEASDVPAYYAPRAWTFEYWNGAAWVVADTQADHTAWTGGEMRAVAVPAVPVIWDCSIEGAGGQVVEGVTGLVLRGRFHAGINLETVIRFRGSTYHVQSVEDLEARGIELRLVVAEVVGRHGSPS